VNAIPTAAIEPNAAIDLSGAAVRHAAPAGRAANSGAATTAAVTRPAGPVRWRLALLTLLGVYPVITAYLYALLPLTEGWEMWQRTLVLAPLMIVSMVYGIAPLLQKYFGWFLRPAARS
jgi:antibiotic biosynthesis monooxygenase (ABM) superfamily enzyme